ncbi:hypothetical protein P3X46_003046 [Hevea brasiliensis]|uniref:Uncharacterized protein n=1 Tax=Hevea brasiliensis TaxID=3981 RepID=A0ABQ9N5R2_HEVBR|nr:uncharacterized protein LOC110643340 isoform X2 [Hevea brasiliensis]XP_021651386.2 uncharacterized protein LOC110643340 isoform X2 [Hevea brasiliensis]XP_021651387.2 uncharacterized protein LOC110643340 isoform X2 [Hevea brasiliensis]KAJ9187616.1 hypothetical protein P3X46_003046 [Hevea brasiliensis]
MGNCQAIDAAALVIQHPCGKIERLYWPISASEVMRLNPGHYVSLIIPLPLSGDQDKDNSHQKKTTVQFTRVKLLRPTDTLALGHAYRLVTTQEVMKVLRAKKHAKMRRQQQQQQRPESVEKPQMASEKKSLDCEAENRPADTEKDKEKDHQAIKSERRRPRASSITSTALRSKSWRPTLQSISEAAS